MHKTQNKEWVNFASETINQFSFISSVLADFGRLSNVLTAYVSDAEMVKW